MDHEFRSVEERRAAIVALLQKETGIDETMIETLIRAFYTRVRQDALLAPIFASRISDWEPHLDNMFAFWSSLTLHTGCITASRWRSICPWLWMRATSIDGSRCSRRRRARFASVPRPSGLVGRAVASRRAWSWRRQRQQYSPTQRRTLSARGVITCRRTASATLCPCPR